MTHNRKCPNCGSIGNWNWANEREELTMPNGDRVMAKVIVKGEESIKCPNCGTKFEPRSHALLRRNLSRVVKKIESV